MQKGRNYFLKLHHGFNGQNWFPLFYGYRYQIIPHGGNYCSIEDLNWLKKIILISLFQLVYLSQERISFGNLPLFSRARRMVFVSNRSKENDISFEWHVTSQADAQVVINNLFNKQTKISPKIFFF